MSFITAALIMTAGSALNANIAKNRQSDPKANLNASATGAGSPGGVPLNIKDIEGTDVAGADITPFAYMPYDDNGGGEEEQLMALLQQLSSEEAGGVMSAATGRYLSRGTGGGITTELLQKLLNMKDVKFDSNKSIEEMLALEPISEIPESRSPMEIVEAQTQNTMPTEDIITAAGNAPSTGIAGLMDKVSGFAEKNPAVFNAITSTLTDLISTAIKGTPEPPPSRLDSRPMIAGNANRRAAQMNFKPIGAKSGGVLNRKMFSPMFHGGELDGPGGPKDDLIPVMASDGEFMLSKAAVDQAGGGNHNKGIARLTAFNNKGNKRYG